MNARHSHSTAWSARAALLAMIAVACAATMLATSESGATSLHPGIYAVSDDDKDLILRIENSTFPTPPMESETSPWPGLR
jgi:hypothetical protein